MAPPGTLIHYWADSALYWTFSIVTIRYFWMNARGFQVANVLHFGLPQGYTTRYLQRSGAVLAVILHTHHLCPSTPQVSSSPLPDVVTYPRNQNPVATRSAGYVSLQCLSRILDDRCSCSYDFPDAFQEPSMFPPRVIEHSKLTTSGYDSAPASACIDQRAENWLLMKTPGSIPTRFSTPPSFMELSSQAIFVPSMTASRTGLINSPHEENGRLVSRI
ncbi:uncharacterized protein BT62DRAFT_1081331 [Guyanagaster necrorhizus]|uniref:Uncharacterized protein n=1 Tax=Guyanagaster necrorhizus TaxID=856835 RepID=A0A9P7VFW0_9AGAR|nr:uncharacterized protein BT62DRAFT_1081331 [Guyanagaster necrorhizus MCA 3950]KAG7439823.1 hypothetical protein BT62DRAFT_1081331 [Guyanagaster necrorhizus MCA 3950]